MRMIGHSAHRDHDVAYAVKIVMVDGSTRWETVEALGEDDWRNRRLFTDRADAIELRNWLNRYVSICEEQGRAFVVKLRRVTFTQCPIEPVVP